jgi:hypothetical protein
VGLVYFVFLCSSLLAFCSEEEGQFAICNFSDVGSVMVAFRCDFSVMGSILEMGISDYVLSLHCSLSLFPC